MATSMQIWEQLAMRLGKSPDLEAAFAQLAKYPDIGPAWLLFHVHRAYRGAQREVRRGTHQDEADQVTKVKKLARQLREAILRGPFPLHEGKSYSMDVDDLRWQLYPTWHGRPLLREDFGAGFHFAITDILELVEQMADDYLSEESPRAVPKAGSNFFLMSFVRRLSASIQDATGGALLYGTVARITNAALDLDDPLDAKAVEKMLRASPLKA